MKIKTALLLVLSFCFSNRYACATTLDTLSEINVAGPYAVVVDSLSKDSLKIDNQKVKPRRRIVAALLCITLGPFGMHRLYLGTQPRVAGAYTLTLGGGFGLIPVIDLFHIVFSRDLSKFKDNDQFIMWAK